MPPQHVLVADDEPSLLRLLTRVLERTGRTVHSVLTGDEAVARLSDPDARVDLLLVDAGIRPDGLIPVLEAATPSGARVIVISGKGLEPKEQALLDACGGGFLAKPFSPAGLLAAIDGT